MFPKRDSARCRRTQLIFVGALALDVIRFSLLVSYRYGKASGRRVIRYDWLMFDLVPASGDEYQDMVYRIPFEDELPWHPERN